MFCINDIRNISNVPFGQVGAADQHPFTIFSTWPLCAQFFFKTRMSYSIPIRLRKVYTEEDRNKLRQELQTLREAENARKKQLRMVQEEKHKLEERRHMLQKEAGKRKYTETICVFASCQGNTLSYYHPMVIFVCIVQILSYCLTYCFCRVIWHAQTCICSYLFVLCTAQLSPVVKAAIVYTVFQESGCLMLFEKVTVGFGCGSLFIPGIVLRVSADFFTNSEVHWMDFAA